MARNPLLLGAVAAGLLFCLPWLDGEPGQTWSTQLYTQVGLVASPIYFAAFVLGNVTAMRERSATTAELFSGVPTSYMGRTLAILLAGAVPTAASVVVITVHQTLVIRAGGITVGDQPTLIRLTPTVLELALVPAITASSYTAGVALARTIQSRVVGVMLGTILCGLQFMLYWMWAWFPAYFLAPYTGALRRDTRIGPQLSAAEVSSTMLIAPDGYNPSWWVLVREADRVGWHVLYLIGVTVLLAGYVLRRGGRDPRVRHLLGVGVVLVLAGLIGQLAVHGGPFPWFGDVGSD
jgi:hypothetical protein